MVRFPSERSIRGMLSITMREFSNFTNSRSLIDPPLEGGRFTCSIHEEVLVLSCIDWFLFSVD